MKNEEIIKIYSKLLDEFTRKKLITNILLVDHCKKKSNRNKNNIKSCITLKFTKRFGE